jgi:hypothetical protein
MVDAAFNKYRGKAGHGTLIGNWQEERDLRDFTGEGRYVLNFNICFINLTFVYSFRTITKTHIPKKHHDFENPISHAGFDNTQNRIYGEQNQQLMTTNNTEYGTAKNSADGIARAGRKGNMMEREIERQVMAEMAERQKRIDSINEERYFDTTNRENLVA